MAKHKFSLMRIATVRIFASYKICERCERTEKTLWKSRKQCKKFEILDVDPSSYGNLLVPLINAKLPNELWLLISRKFENEVWLLSDLLKHLKIEIEAKERSVSLGHFYTERVESNRDNRFTTSALLTLEELREKQTWKCVFYNSRNHPPWRCLKVSNPQHKRTILKRNGLYFICFRKGHLASSCILSNYSCNKCKGNHSISICIESKKPNVRSNTWS